MSKLFQIRVVGGSFNSGLDAFVSGKNVKEANKVFENYKNSMHFKFVTEAIGMDSGEDISTLFNNCELRECPGISVNSKRNGRVIFSLGEESGDWAGDEENTTPTEE